MAPHMYHHQYEKLSAEDGLNHIIVEGIWGIGKTTVAETVADLFGYKIISEPSHLEAASDEDVSDLQRWYRNAHTQLEAHLEQSAPCIVERSILSVFAFEYASTGVLPDEEEMKRIRQKLEETKTLLVFLSPYQTPYRAEHQSTYSEKIQFILQDKDAQNRYFEFYLKILPWQFGIAPLVLPSINEETQRDAKTVATEIRTAIGAQRVAQINVICMDPHIGPDGPQILLLRRTPKRGGFWQTITGGIHPGEPLPSVAIRETTEETNVTIQSSDLQATYFSHTFIGNDGYQLTEYVFVAWIHEPKNVQLSEEHDEMRWVSAEEAKTLMAYESNRRAIDHAIETIQKRPTE